MLELQRIGIKPDILVRKSFFISKYISQNAFTIPSCKRMRIVFPLYEVEGVLRSKSIMILLEFLEQISGVRAIIKKANLIVGSGLWVRGQVDLSGFNLMRFFLFFNEFCVSHPLLRFSSRLPFLRVIRYNTVKLVLSDIDFFFDASTRRSLPSNKNYWLELDFFFENNFKLTSNVSAISFYTQFFFSHNILEWRNQSS